MFFVSFLVGVWGRGGVQRHARVFGGARRACGWKSKLKKPTNMNFQTQNTTRKHQQNHTKFGAMWCLSTKTVGVGVCVLCSCLEVRASEKTLTRIFKTQNTTRKHRSSTLPPSSPHRNQQHNNHHQQQYLGREHVDAGIDLVAHERLRLLDKALHLARRLVDDDNAILGRVVDLLFFGFCCWVFVVLVIFVCARGG